jgi:isopenicillin N synthase-like dioxygenase
MPTILDSAPTEHRSPAGEFGRVPVIDIAPFLANEPKGRHAVVLQVRHACEQVGFFSIVGHGVSPALLDSIRAVSNQFFDLPLEEKLKVQRAQAPGSRGYALLGDLAHARSLGYATPPDLQEGYSVGTLRIPPNDPYYQSDDARKFFPPNIWPRHPAEFRTLVEDYYERIERLAADIMRIFALALDLEEHFFADKMDKAVNLLRLVRYPAQENAPLEGQLRSGQHTDYGTLTILLAEDKPGGLQVRTRDGGWVDVHPVPESFVINIGDLMMQWTNDHWLSNLHRVANPPRAYANVPRLSIVFFQKPNYDAEIRCIEKYAGAKSAPKYAPTTAGEHWYQKNAKTREVSQAGR